MKTKRILSLMGVFHLDAGAGRLRKQIDAGSAGRRTGPAEHQLSQTLCRWKPSSSLGRSSSRALRRPWMRQTAAQLIPLYTLLQQMSTSGTAAQAEIDAVLEQIQATMTTDQIHAIAAMKLTPDGNDKLLLLLRPISEDGDENAGRRFGGGGGFPGRWRGRAASPAVVAQAGEASLRAGEVAAVRQAEEPA